MRFLSINFQVRRFISCWAQTQRLSVKEQLDHGVRFLDFRVSKCPTDGQYYIVHSFCGPALVDVLRQVSEFANRNAKEIILIEVVPCSFVDHCELHELFERHLAGLLLRRDKSSAIMSPITLELSHLLEVGRVVLLYKPSNFSSAAVGDCLSFWDGSCVHAPFLETLDPQEKESFQLEQFEHFDSTSHTRVLKHTQLFHFMYSLTPKLKEIVLSLCGRGRPVSLEGCADMLNPRLQRFLDEITQNQKVQGMIVSVDYVDKSQLVQMILDINQRNL